MKRRKLAKMLVLAMSVILCLETLNITGVQAAPSSWAEDEINLATQYHLVLDYADGRYQEDITRGFFAGLIVNMIENILGQEIELTIESPFVDTEDDEVIKAYQIGIVNGRTPTTYAPEAFVERQEMAVMFVRAINYLISQGEEQIIIPDLGALPFDDIGLISDYAFESMFDCFTWGIIKGSNGLINPRGYVSIEQSLIMIFRVYIMFDEEALNDYNDMLNESAGSEDGLGDDQETGARVHVNEGFIYIQAKDQAYEGQNDAWWRSQDTSAKEWVLVDGGRMYRPALVGEILAHPGCNVFDYHTNLTDDDDFINNANEWALYDLLAGTYTGTESGNNYITAMDYAASRGHQLPTIEQLEILAGVLGADMETDEEWPIGYYWSSTPSSDPSKQYAMKLPEGNIVELEKGFDGLVASYSSGMIVENVVFYGETYYRPLDMDKVADYGADEEKSMKEYPEITYALYDAELVYKDGLTAETIAYDLGYRLPSTEELLLLYESFPGGYIKSKLGWPIDQYYWTINENGIPTKVNMIDGTYYESNSWSARQTTGYVTLIEDKTMKDEIYISQTDTVVLRPQRVDELPPGIIPTETFEWMGETYPLFDDINDADTYYDYMEYGKSQGLRLLEKDEIETLLEDFPGTNLSFYYGWPSGTNGMSPICYYMTPTQIHMMGYLYSTLTGKILNDETLYLEGIEQDNLGIVVFVKE